MSPRRFPAVLVCALVPTVSASALGMPYTGIVNRDGVPLRSGPGKEYYSTDVLKQGDRVEVQRIDEGGWCAVRPPSGSFCWVAGRHLRVADDEDVAEVVGDNVMAYVGSHVRDAQDVVQVRLSRGESVRVLGAERLPAAGARGTAAWFRIAPPAGEFRWVHLEYVDRPRETAGVAEQDRDAARVTADEGGGTAATDSIATSAGAPAAEPAAGGDEADAQPATATEGEEKAEESSAAQGKSAVFAAKWKPLPPGTLDKRAGRAFAQKQSVRVGQTKVAGSHRQPPNKSPAVEAVSVTDAETAPRLLGTVQATPLRPASATETAVGERTARQVVVASATDESGSYEEQIEAINVEFSLMVARPRAQWQLKPLIARAQTIARQADAPLVRDNALKLVEKMRQFDHLQKGASPLGNLVVPSAAAAPAVAKQPGFAVAGSPPVDQRSPGQPGPAFMPARGGLPKLLSAIDSLMPPPPTPARGGPPATMAVLPTATPTVNPSLATAAVQSPESAPPAPAGLSWRPSAGSSTPVPHSPPGVNVPGQAAVSAPGVARGSAGVLGTLKDAVLYPFGSGTPNAPPASGTLPTYDGHGWLMPLVSRRGSTFSSRNYMPPFALTDRDGNILQFVTPAPGVNLHRYLKKEIGLFGQQHPLEHLEQPHITASRVVLLERHRR
jgi:hypothetical protein